MRGSRPQDKDIVLIAFLAVREGHSAEYVLCNPDFNARFVERCVANDVAVSASELNTRLLNLRKRGALTNFPTTRRKSKASPTMRAGVQNAVRFLERQLATTLDNILCNPDFRDQFDALMQILVPECSVLEARYSALTLRKKSLLKPEVVGRIVETVAGSVTPLKDIQITDVPNSPGVYLFFDWENTLYAGKADSLRRRIDDHLSTWTARDLISQIRKGYRADVFLVLHVLKADITLKALFAYETEIIRSRNPSHNRAGKLSK